MNSIVRFRLSGLWNSEYPLVVNRIIDIAGKHNPEMLHLSRSYNQLAAFKPQLAKIEAQERSDRDSARLSELDQERDTLFNVIREVTKCFNRISLPPFNASAAEIMIILKKHGNAMTAANYTAETKRLYDLLPILNVPR